jgi:hypothetical protein
MKQFARKSGPLSIVRSPAAPTAELCVEEHAVALRESFDGWLTSVAPTLLPAKATEDEPKDTYKGWRPLTLTDIVRVNRATIRESTAPRVWPPDVVLSFLAAEVIKRNRAVSD